MEILRKNQKEMLETKNTNKKEKLIWWAYQQTGHNWGKKICDLEATEPIKIFQTETERRKKNLITKEYLRTEGQLQKVIGMNTRRGKTWERSRRNIWSHNGCKFYQINDRYHRSRKLRAPSIINIYIYIYKTTPRYIIFKLYKGKEKENLEVREKKTYL